MSNTIYLIVEDETDVDVVRAILKAKQIDIYVSKLIPTGKTGGVSRLASQLERLIKTALEKRKSNDCIAVLHDADENVQTDRKSYEEIKEICKRYSVDVVLIVAHDEIEAWLLADEGLCKWLGEKPHNCDEETQPSLRLNRAVKKKTGKDYTGKMRNQVLEKINGTGDNSPSMRLALTHLDNAVCIR